MKSLIALLVIFSMSFSLKSAQQKATVFVNDESATADFSDLKYIPKRSISESSSFRLTKITGIHGNLMAHSKYIFLEYVAIEESEFEEMEELTETYPGESSLFKSYRLTSSDLKHKYVALLNSNVTVNNYDREQFKCKIIDLVIVNDLFNEPPYLAAVTNLETDNENIYYAWATSNSKLKLDNFKLVDQHTFYEGYEDDLASFSTVKTVFEKAKFYINYEKQLIDNEEFYTSFECKKYEAKSGKIYVLVQNRLTGVCESLVDSQVALFELKDDKIALCGYGSFDRFIIDLIDLDGDGFPEILGGDFSSTGIYNIKSQRVKLKSEFSWSFSGCPC